MADSRQNWLNQNPNTTSGGSSIPYDLNKMVSMVGMTGGGLIKLANLLQDKVNFADKLNFLFASPTEYLTSLKWVPFKPPLADPTYSGKLVIGSLINTSTLTEDKQVPCSNLLVSQNIQDMGTWNTSSFVNRFNDYRDTDPYTQIDIFLPYVGYVTVPSNDFFVKGKPLRILLDVDYLQCTGMYYICVDETPTNQTSSYEYYRIISTHAVNLGYDIPISSTNMIEISRNLTFGLIKAGAIVGGVALGGYLFGGTGAMFGGMTSSQVTNSTQTITNRAKNPNTNRLINENQKITETTTTSTRKQPNFGMITATSMSASQSVTALSNAQLRASSSQVSNPMLLRATTKCVKIVIRQVQTIDPNSNDYKKIYGRPYGQIDTLDNLSGFTQVHVARLENFNNTLNDELVMIDELLKSGIILP